MSNPSYDATGTGFCRKLLASGRVRRAAVATFLLLAIAYLGPLFAPHEPSDIVGIPFDVAGVGVWLGTDYLGQDIFSRILCGGRSVVWMSTLASLIAIVFGAALGLFAAYAGGLVDTAVGWFNDILLAFPLIVLVILFLSMLGHDPSLIVVVVAIGWLPTVTRLSRGVALSVIHQEYVAWAELVGMPRYKILLKEVLPNVTTPLIVQFGALLTWSIGIIAGLSFLGFGIQPPNADWGLMVNENRSGLMIAPWGTIAPIAMIAFFALAVNSLTDAVSDILGIGDVL
ncbi:ABC transporter permease (plasmid) [Rhizobium sp. CB3171]|uniref:ABC transporter permease n=1 Tax=unclassified Rhizobium TaxID=2613769 RepID=UPI000CDF4FF5|nr:MULTISPECIES: ABC transporter permease [Rhizobium]AVA26614.1 dipeptide/oligopeptide ABC transporter permease protein [Rhizobium sp. NXC24]UWU24347.1 ABC transporter permease [Rhizobium tropici]WFU05327.1 ABC transporter permease [Rhizobium sp. CB3171]